MGRFIAVVAGVALALLPVAVGYVKRYEIPYWSAGGIYACFLLLLVYVVAPAVPNKLIPGRHAVLKIGLMLALPYLVYAAGTGSFHWLALGRLVAVVAPVLIIYSALPVLDAAKLSWQDIVVAIWLVSVVLFHFLNGIWTVPANLDFMSRLFVVSLGALSWTYLRPIPNLGYELVFSRNALLAAATNFVLFAAIAIPLGLLLGFTSWNPRWHGIVDFLLAYLEIFLFIAVLEELFFRGFLQNLLTRSLRSWWRAQLIASLIFGLFHILHAPFPNWRYVILASIAGWFYGSAYRAGGTLISSALLHATVDTTWRTFFTKG
jgi:membrane protease YdiL (CAAX protease family)